MGGKVSGECESSLSADWTAFGREIFSLLTTPGASLLEGAGAVGCAAAVLGEGTFEGLDGLEGRPPPELLEKKE